MLIDELKEISGNIWFDRFAERGVVPDNISVPLSFSSGWRFGGIATWILQWKIIIALFKGALIDWFGSVEGLLVRWEVGEALVDRFRYLLNNGRWMVRMAINVLWLVVRLSEGSEFAVVELIIYLYMLRVNHNDILALHSMWRIFWFSLWLRSIFIKSISLTIYLSRYLSP